MAKRAFTGVIELNVGSSDPDWEQQAPTNTLAGVPEIMVALFEDVGLASWSLLGAAIGAVLGILILRALSIAI